MSALDFEAPSICLPWQTHNISEVIDFDPESVFDLPIIGKGTTRLVYAVSDRAVVKFARGDIEAEANWSEVDRWDSIVGSSEEDFFAPVLGWVPDCSWLIMARCSRLKLSEDSSDELRAFRREVSERFDLEDLSLANIGRDEIGRLRMVDYAY